MCFMTSYAVNYTRNKITIYDDYEPVIHNRNDIYDDLRNCILNGKKEIRIDPAIAIDDISDSIERIYNNDTEIFWLKSNWYALYEPTCTTISFEFKYSDEKIQQMRQDLEFAVKKIIKLSETKNNESDTDKFNFIRRYIMDNTIYDELSEKDDDLMAHTAYGCLVENVAVCDGYAKAFELIATRMGLSAGHVIGSSEPNTDGIDHAWNYIKIDDHYFWTDITWDDITYDRYNKFDMYQFYQMSDAELNETHTIAKDCKLNEFIPICNTQRIL